MSYDLTDFGFDLLDPVVPVSTPAPMAAPMAAPVVRVKPPSAKTEVKTRRGRKPKAGVTRTLSLVFKVTTAEAEKIKVSAEQYGISVAELIRRSLFGTVVHGFIPDRPTIEQL